MLLRTLAPEDAESFFALRLRGLEEFPSAFASSFDEEAGMPLEETKGRLARKPDGAIIGAFDANALIAIVGLQREGLVKLSHKAFIWGMYVAPEARGQGVGFKVLSAALQYASAELRVERVNLGVNTQNAAAVALYKKAGFIQYGLERDFLRVGGKSYDEYQMVCTVSSEPSLVQADA